MTKIILIILIILSFKSIAQEYEDDYSDEYGEAIEQAEQSFKSGSTQNFKTDLKNITNGHFGEDFLKNQRDSNTGLEISYDTQKDLNRFNAAILFNSDLRDFTDMFIAEVGFGMFLDDNKYLDFFLNTQRNKYGTMASRASDINGAGDVIDQTKESFFSFGMGPTYRTYFTRDLVNLDNLYETIHAGVGLGWFFEELSNEGYFGPGVKADFGIHYRISKNFHIGTKLSWNHYWVKRDENFVDEPQGIRTISLTWLSFGLDFALYL